MQITKYYLSSYILGKTIGKGTFGKVKLAVHRTTNQPVAIKILEKDKIKDVTDVERVSRQLHILKITRHSSIAQMYEIIQTTSNIFIVMEYAKHGEFFDYIMDCKIQNQAEVHHYFTQILSGINYLHELQICHRDIKPQNMLLDSHNRLKIVDFGLSNMYKFGEDLTTACGSPCYASPQMIRGQKYSPQLTDVWSLGVVLFSMALAKLPFEDENTSVLYNKIKSGLYVIDKRISHELKDLLSKMLCVDPNCRITLQGIKEHQWFKNRKGIKSYGIKIGYQSLPVDQGVLEELSKLNYEAKKIKQYLENNIRNESTTAYWLLLKRKYRNKEPSSFDVCNESFNPKVLIGSAKMILPKQQESRHKSFDFYSLYKDADFQLKKSGRKSQNKRYKNSPQRKQRNCVSQLATENNEFERIKNYLKLRKNRREQSLLKSSHLHQTIITENNRKKKILNQSVSRRNIPSQGKKESSYESLNRRIHTKNIQKQENININIYIHNQSKRSKSKKKQMTPIKSQEQTRKFSVMRKRMKTEGIQDSKMDHWSLNKQKDRHLLQDTFWKKKSMNSKTKEHTTDTRKMNNRYIK